MSTKGKRDFRPEYHMTPKQMWMNDPNGMFYRDGEWHLCYQYYPEATHWGPMHWGHAVSRDLVNWEQFPIALKPDECGMIFSGSAVVDTENRSGLGEEGKAPVIAMYTSHGEWEQQSIAYSLDGIQFEAYAGNPVIPNQEKRDFRDPKLFWNEAKGCFGVVLAAGDHVEFYASRNLRDWEKTGGFIAAGEWCQDAVWECPDLFPLDGKWVLLVSTGAIPGKKGSCTWYFVGEFDGERFITEMEEPKRLDFGYDDYAGVTWSGSQERVFIGWASNWLYADKLPTGEFCGQMTFARRLCLRQEKNSRSPGQQEGKQWTLQQQPCIAKKAMPHLQELGLEDGKQVKAITSEVFHISLAGVRAGEGVRLKNALGQVLEIGVNGQGCVYVDRRRVLPGWRESSAALKTEPFDPIFASEAFGMAAEQQNQSGESEKEQDKQGGKIPETLQERTGETLQEAGRDLEIYWDHSVLEVYADGGSTVLTMLAYPDEPFSELSYRGRTPKQPPTGETLAIEEAENRVKLVIFDMDGLMFDTENLFFRYYQEEAGKLGYELTRDFYLKTVGANATSVKRITRELLGEDFPREEASRRAHGRIGELLQTQQIPVKKGLYRLLEYLKKQGILCTVASSSAEETIRKYLKSAGIEGFFACLVNGNEVERSKPEPDIFLKACEFCGVKPEEALVLEDSQNGILAGWRAGIPVVCVPDMKVPESDYAAKTSLICQDLDEVLSLCQERGYL